MNLTSRLASAAVIALLILPVFSNAQYFIVNDSVTFDEGAYQDTLFNSSFVQLNGSSLLGVYYSEVFDAGNVSSWSTISWVEGCPYGEPLPNYQGSEYGAVYCGIDMTGNRLLMHLDDFSSPIVDFSGNGNNGTSDAIYFKQSGVIGYSALFYNDSSKISLGVPLIIGTDDFTFGVWIKRSAATEGYILGNYGTANPLGVFFQIRGIGDLYFFLAGSVLTSTTKILFNGLWYHIAVKRFSGNVTLFVNGRPITSKVMAGNIIGNLNFTIGHSPDYSIDVFDGNIDELFVMNRSMSDIEIRDVFQRGAADLSTSVRSCDTVDCSGIIWSTTYYHANLNFLSLSANKYFQFKSDFSCIVPNVIVGANINTPKLYSVTVGYNLAPTPSPSPTVSPTAIPVMSNAQYQSIMRKLRVAEEITCDGFNLCLLDWCVCLPIFKATEMDN